MGLLAQSNIKSYRDADNRIDRYYICSNTSMSIKVRNGAQLEIKIRDDDFQDEMNAEHWTRYIIKEVPSQLSWDSISETLSRCDTFSWIPEENACNVRNKSVSY